HRHGELAEPRQQHHHCADARKHQHEGGGERGEKRDVDLHVRYGTRRAGDRSCLIATYWIPMIRAASLSISPCSASAMNGSATSMVRNMARIFGTKTRVIS